jgi:hypothetical protein
VETTDDATGREPFCFGRRDETTTGTRTRRRDAMTGTTTGMTTGMTTTDAVVTSATVRAMEAVRAEVEKFQVDASATLGRSDESVEAAAVETRGATARMEARERKLREEMACIRENVESVMVKATELLSGRDDG